MAVLDPRQVANTILEFAHEFELEVSNLALQKILYFVQGRHLVERGAPLLEGEFEAWPYGPVHPVVYDTFKLSGSSAIASRATAFDYVAGKPVDIGEIADKRLKLFVRETAAAYLRVSPGRLVELSHAKNSPWDVITRDGNGRVYGARIPNALILQNFRHHKTTIHSNPILGEPDEETPPTRN